MKNNYHVKNRQGLSSASAEKDHETAYMLEDTKRALFFRYATQIPSQNSLRHIRIKDLGVLTK